MCSTPARGENIFPLTTANGVGVLVSYALRRALSQPERLKKLCAELVSNGVIPAGRAESRGAVGFRYQRRRCGFNSRCGLPVLPP